MRQSFRVGKGSGEGLRQVNKEYLFHFGHFEIEVLVAPS